MTEQYTEEKADEVWELREHITEMLHELIRWNVEAPEQRQAIRADIAADLEAIEELMYPGPATP